MLSNRCVFAAVVSHGGCGSSSKYMSLTVSHATVVVDRATSLFAVYRQDCLVFRHPSPWCRLLVHKVSAFYGLEHNVDSTKTNVTVSRTKITRM